MGDINLLNLFEGAQILDKSGNKVTVESLHGKLVGIYFSAHWCPPCRNFTPQLAQKYADFQNAGHPFEIIFVSLNFYIFVGKGRPKGGNRIEGEVFEMAES